MGKGRKRQRIHGLGRENRMTKGTIHCDRRNGSGEPQGQEAADSGI